MSDRVRTAVMMIVLAVWAAVIGAYLWRGQLPDAALLGVPAAVILALAPPTIGWRRNNTAAADEAAKPAAEGDTA